MRLRGVTTSRLTTPSSSKGPSRGWSTGSATNTRSTSPRRRRRRSKRSINKRFEGVGMEVAPDPQTKQLTVRTPLVGSPAFEAGVRAGDRILKVDGRSTQGMSLRDAIDRLHGEPGTSVTISVLHEGDKRAVELEMVCRTIVVDTVRGDKHNADGSWNFFLPGHDRIGYVRILSFSEKTADDLRQALDGLTAKRMRGLVLDLRDNPGGLLPSAVNVCDMFLPGGLIVSTARPRQADSRGPACQRPGAVHRLSYGRADQSG